MGLEKEGGRWVKKLRAIFARSADPVAPEFLCSLNSKSPFTVNDDSMFGKPSVGLSYVFGLLGPGA